MSVVVILTGAFSLGGAASKTKHKQLPTRPNLAQINVNGSTHGLVFKTATTLFLYCHDVTSAGQPIPLQTYVAEGAATLIPNGTLVEILSPRVLSAGDTGAQYVQIRMKEGYWKGRNGYILWEELAALPKPSKPASQKPTAHQ